MTEIECFFKVVLMINFHFVVFFMSFFFFFCNLFYFFFYNALHYLQNIGYNICITLLTIHTYTYNNLVFCFFYTFTLH